MTDDAERWSRLFAETQQSLYALARQRVSPADAVAETYARALAAFDRYRPDRPVVAWLTGILRNVLREQARGRREDPFAMVDEPRWDDAAALLVAAEDAARVRRAVALLGEQERRIIVLRVIEGQCSADVARATGQSAAAVRMAQTRALRRLHAVLSCCGR